MIMSEKEYEQIRNKPTHERKRIPLGFFKVSEDDDLIEISEIIVERMKLFEENEELVIKKE